MADPKTPNEGGHPEPSLSHHAELHAWIDRKRANLTDEQIVAAERAYYALMTLDQSPENISPLTKEAIAAILHEFAATLRR